MTDTSFALLFGEKGKIICEKILSLQRRFPHLLKSDALRELGCYISHCSESFFECHSIFLLIRIFFLFRRLTTEVHAEHNLLKILKINSSIYGIAFALSNPHESQSFNDKHIFKATQKLIPGITAISTSFLSYPFRSKSVYYLEIKKIRENGFSSHEQQKLRTELFHELEMSIKSIHRPLFFPGNEEELFKNIRHLSQEIKSIHDLPQVMITFVEYLPLSLKFLVIALRVIKPLTPSLLSLSSQLPFLVQFSLEKSFYVGQVRKKYPKEASIFFLEVKSSPFIHDRHTINLRAVRHYIAKATETMLGPFRDYNGGLLNKENELLFAIKNALLAQGIPDLFLEDIFYNIKPIDMRLLITVETGVELISSFQKMLNSALEGEKKYLNSSLRCRDIRIALVKTGEITWKTTLVSRVLSCCPQIGCSIFEWEGFLYLCFFHQYTNSDILFDTLHNELKQHTNLAPSNNTILNINFQSGDPPSLNPRLAADMPSHILSNLLFEGLTCMNKAGEAEPAIAEKIEISSCGTIYTFHLRQAWWSNGEEVTAYHFENAWKKSLMAFSGFPYPDFFFLIKNVEQVRAKQISLDEVGIQVKDAKTLCIFLTAPCSYFLNLVATPPFFPLLGDNEEPSDFNGPFTLAEWKRSSYIHLSQNPFYRDAQRIKLGGIKIAMVRDPYTAYELFQKGELDFLGDPISPLPPDVIKQPKMKPLLIRKQVSRIFWIHCNTKMFPLHNIHLRRALSLSLNRKQITEKVFFYQIPQLSPLPYKYSQFHGMEEGDPNLARTLFNKALKELGIEQKDFPNLRIIYSDLSFEEPLLKELKLQWKEILGVDIVFHYLRWNEFSAAIEKGDFQLCGLFRRDFFNNVLFYLNFFKAAPMNPYSLENEKYAALLNILNKGKQDKNTLKKMENILIKETPVIPLVNQTFIALISNQIKGIAWDENGCLNLKNVWIDEKAH